MVDDSGDPLVVRFREALLVARVREPALREPPTLPGRGVAEAMARHHLACYDEPGRRHHDRRHLVEVLAEVDRLVALDDSWGQVPLSVELAVMFHDVVYDPRADDNEERSARHADQALAEFGVARAARDEVARLVRVTATHAPAPDDSPGHLLVDGDLWILAAPRERYDDYVRDVRAEYAHLDDRQWRRGRTGVLDRLAGRIERSGYLVGPADDRHRRAVAAHSNIARERRELQAPGAA